MIDIHCHILPAVDDGSQSEEESLAMLAAAKKAGIDKIICTPHYHDSSFSQEAVNKAFKWFKEQASVQGVDVHLGYEIHWRRIAQLGMEEAVLEHLLGDTEYALIEFSCTSEIGQLEQRLLWKLRGKGVVPIIAHPERYAAIQEDRDLADELKDAGCLLQMSADAIRSSRFSSRGKAYRYMLKNGLYDYVASDAHCVDDYNDFLKATKAASAIVTSQFDFVG